MTKIILAAALTSTLALAAAPASAQEGNGDFFRLRTPAVASATLAARPDTGAEDAPTGGVAFAEPAASTRLAANAGESSVQTADSLPPGALDGAPADAYAQSVRRSFAAR